MKREAERAAGVRELLHELGGGAVARQWKKKYAMTSTKAGTPRIHARRYLPMTVSGGVDALNSRSAPGRPAADKDATRRRNPPVPSAGDQ